MSSSSIAGDADDRMMAMRDWLVGPCDLQLTALEPASADASFRRYFRAFLGNGETRIVMDAPPAGEDTRPFVTLAARFRSAGLNTPRVFAADVGSGFLLLDDFGGQSYLDALTASPAEANRLYGHAIDSLVKLQGATPALADRLPDYDRALLQRELDLFPRWFCTEHLGLRFSQGEMEKWQACCEVLVASALAEPQVAVHRDYHSRNLMVTAERNPGVLDFQDAVLGPASYDLVSLLKDCYIVWPGTDRDRWLDDYVAATAAAGRPMPDAPSFAASFNRMGIQRHLKVLGIFARLNYRDGKVRYLSDLPVVMAYLIEALPAEPQLAFLFDFLSERCGPCLHR